MSAKGVMKRVQFNAQTMSGDLMRTRDLVKYDCCCGIHGAMRFRRGVKKGTSAARRRLDKVIVRDEREP